MNAETILWTLFGVSMCLYAARVIRRRRKSYSEYIVPELDRIGLSVRAIRTAPLFNVGPFPKIEFKVGGVQSKTPVGRGEFTEYRIVDAVDSEGRSVTIWCKLEFELFSFKSIEILQQNN
jgi:hypothetical protein